MAKDHPAPQASGYLTLAAYKIKAATSEATEFAASGQQLYMQLPGDSAMHGVYTVKDGNLVKLAEIQAGDTESFVATGINIEAFGLKASPYGPIAFGPYHSSYASESIDDWQQLPRTGLSLMQQDFSDLPETPESSRPAKPGDAGGGCAKATGANEGKICIRVKDHFGFERPLLSFPELAWINQVALRMVQKQGVVPKAVKGQEVTPENMHQLAHLQPIYRVGEEEVEEAKLTEMLSSGQEMRLIVDWHPLPGHPHAPPSEETVGEDIEITSDVDELADEAADKHGKKLAADTDKAASEAKLGKETSSLNPFGNLTAAVSEAKEGVGGLAGGFTGFLANTGDLWKCIDGLPHQYSLSYMMSIASKPGELPKNLWRTYVKPAFTSIEVWAGVSVREVMHGTREVLVNMGPSDDQRKCVTVHAGSLKCAPTAAEKGEAGSRWKGKEGEGSFEVTFEGEEVCASRTDGAKWDFDLGFTCKDEYKEYVIPIGPIEEDEGEPNKKCVTVDAEDLFCHPDAANAGHRINTEITAEGTYSVSTSGQEICVERTDNAEPWTMNLRIICFARSLNMDITLLADGTWKMLVIDGLWLKLRRPAATKQQRYALKRSDGSDMELVRHGGATLAVASLALLAFHPTFHGTWEFLWDDLENFGPEAQPFLRVTWANLAAWGGPETAAFSLRVYEPLALALKSCAAEAAELSCRNLHILAGACHALAAALAFLGTKAIARGDEDLTWRSALGAGLFAVHPLCAQVVCWASCLPYIWSTIFSWLAVLLFLHSLRSGAAAVAGRSAALSAACYAAAALCKAAALPLPAMLTLLRLSYGQPAKRPPELLHWLGFCVLLRWALLAAQDGEEVQSVAVQLTPQDNLLRAAGSVFAHLMLLWPGEAVPFQPLALAGLTPAQRWLGAFAAALLAMSASYALWRLREARWCSLWLSFLALLSPCLQLVQHGDPVWFADRYGYLPMCLVLPSVVVLLPKSRARWALAGPLLALLAYQSQGRCQLWRNGTDLWAAAAASNPQWPEFHHQLGVCLAASSRHAEAEAALRNAWALRQDAITAKALGHLEGLKKPKEGLRWLAEALALGLSKKQAASALHDMAALESRKKRPKLQRVLELYNQSLQLAPRRGLTQESFGLALAVAERFPEAVQALQAARSLGRNGADLHHGLGHALLAQGRAAEAQSAFEEALRLRPKWTEARFGVGRIGGIAGIVETRHLSDMEGLELGRCVLRHLLEPVKEPLIEMIMKALKVVDQLVIWALEQLGYLIGQVVKAHRIGSERSEAPGS
ncbi:unnamed protein product [Effrenium voratum]|uniref:Uncharacterized protein n=1 Tax=Effrenium voratum TaxID=2562239 RepID=A0AA36J0I8_9DINO|nr:unnamed protein product [Effrenium voratum]